MEFGRRRLSTVALHNTRAFAWWAQWHPVNRTKAKLILEFFTARIASFHGSLLVLKV